MKQKNFIKFYAKKDIALVEGVNIKTHFDKKDGLLKKVKVGHSLRDSFLKLLLINLAQTLFYHFHVLGR